MEIQHNLPPNIRQRRAACFKEHVKPGMTFDEVIRLNEQALRLFPVTNEERRQKAEDLMAMPEFVL